MLHKTYLLFVIAVIAALISCSDEESKGWTGGEAVHFSLAGIAGNVSGYTRTSLQEGATVRVLVYKRAGSTADLASDVYVTENTYVAASDGILSACVTDDDGKKISDAGTEMRLLVGTYDFYAITPALKVNSGALTISEGTDYATSLTGAVAVGNSSVQTVALTQLERKCVKLTFNIDRGATSVKSVIIDELKLENLSTSPTSETSIASDLPISTDKNGIRTFTASDFTADAIDAWKASTSAIVLPKSAGSLQLTLTARFNGHSLARTMTTTFPNIAFEKGKEYTFLLKLYGDQIVLNLVSQGTWNNPVSLNTELGLPTSNCYMLPSGSSVNIPVSRANESTLAIDDATLSANGTYTQISSTTNWKTSVLWESVSGLVTLSNSTGTGPAGYFTVTANSPAGDSGGNAVIAIKNSSDSILWSWHIWVTNYDPNTGATNLITNGFRDYVFMDRNLGATSIVKGDIGTVGLLYQWGRKDPFPNSSDWTETEPTLYGEVTSVQASTTPGITQSIRHPITSINQVDTWLDTSNIYLWNTQEGKKTVYDPCPQGWRVPPSYFSGNFTFAPWRYLLIYNYDFFYSDDPYNYGGTYELYGYSFTKDGNSIGFYPSTGIRKRSGKLAATGSAGYYWIATPKGHDGYYFAFTEGAGGPGASIDQSYLYAVRCVKE
ncbi:BF2992 family fimbrillin-A clan protein [uncultured Bacteroides sp.]|uniref:fimbrillin family protein n=1 Tax=uncultured Bacteroides sp. TaxID=162156 RepID=UPI002AAAE018|nr:BF2992 family fimbrillin-A clan protein [uncultured Bacteroides sp.]